MSGRFSKTNGAVNEDFLRRTQEWIEVRNFDRPKTARPVVNPRDVFKRVNQTRPLFGKKIAEQMTRRMAGRAGLALLGPIGDLALGALTLWELYELFNQNNSQRVGDDLPYEDVPFHYTVIPPYPNLTGWTLWQQEAPEYWENYPGWENVDIQLGERLWVNTEGPGYGLARSTFDANHRPWIGYHARVGFGGWTYLTDCQSTLNSPLENDPNLPRWWNVEIYRANPATVTTDPFAPSLKRLRLGFASPNVLRDAPSEFDFQEALTPPLVPGSQQVGSAFASPVPDTLPRLRFRNRLRPRPPRLHERHSKHYDPNGKVAKMLKVLDITSEGAEVLDAFYEALPEETKRKWGCSKIKRGLIDSAGQYGIDAADCKGRAVWHNWHNIDIAQGIKNLVANEIQDRVIGNIMRLQPTNVGSTTSDAMQQVNEWLQGLFEEVGLS